MTDWSHSLACSKDFCYLFPSSNRLFRVAPEVFVVVVQLVPRTSALSSPPFSSPSSVAGISKSISHDGVLTDDHSATAMRDVEREIADRLTPSDPSTSSSLRWLQYLFDAIPVYAAVRNSGFAPLFLFFVVLLSCAPSPETSFFMFRVGRWRTPHGTARRVSKVALVCVSDQLTRLFSTFAGSDFAMMRPFDARDIASHSACHIC